MEPTRTRIRTLLSECRNIAACTRSNGASFYSEPQLAGWLTTAKRNRQKLRLLIPIRNA